MCIRDRWLIVVNIDDTVETDVFKNLPVTLINTDTLTSQDQSYRIEPVSYTHLVIGTGDMSELALGWATYNGDHMSMYGVNVSVPKTLVRHLVRYYACLLYTSRCV